MQDTLLDAVERALPTWSRARPSCCRCWWWARRCATGTGSTTARSSCTAGGSSGWRRSRTCRPTGSSTSGARSRRATTCAGTVLGRRAVEVPFGPDLLFAAEDLPGFVLHVEICEDMWVPVPPSAEAALAGATVLANLSGSPITVGRAEDRQLLCRSASSRCLAAYVYAAAGEGESTTDLAWDGQTMIYENGVLLAETERFPQGRAALGRRRRPRPAARRAAADGHLRRQPPPPRRPRRGASATIGFRLDPPSTDIGLRRAVERFPFVPADPARLEQDCYEAYNIQVSGLEQRLRAIGQPKVVIGVSGGLDSTHALIVAARAMDRRGPAAQRHPRLHAARLRHRRAHQGQRAPAHARRSASRARSWTSPPTARLMLDEPGPPVLARASRCTTSRSRTCRPGCAPTTCSARPTSAAASCWAPATCPSWRWAGAPTASATRWRTTTSTRACRRR